MAKKPLPKSAPVVKKKRVGRPKASTQQTLTRRQELFVKELVTNDGMITLREAAINAGYPAGSAHTRAYELTNPHISPHVVSAIKGFRQELDAKYGVTFERHLRDLKDIRDAALQNGAYSAAVQAEFRRGQAHGDIYVSKSEIRTGSIVSMSKDEVVKALNDLKETYAPVTINITPEENDNADNRDKARERILSADEDGSEDFDEETSIH